MNTQAEGNHGKLRRVREMKCIYRASEECHGVGSQVDFSPCDVDCRQAKEGKAVSKETSVGGVCVRCNRPFEKLHTTKYADGLYCDACLVMVAKCVRAGKEVTPYSGRTAPGAKKPPSVAPKKASPPPHPKVPPIVFPEPVHAPLSPAPAPGACVVLKFTCHEISDVRKLLAAGEGLTCSVGLND